ncbi:MAG TPA: protein kinase, partial [Planctomycetota bacterium]|nr:protein kinase [Planctomycetota bacterium]
DIAAGMRLLHNEFQLIHRDLKPQNVLISRRNLTAKVTDLGIGKVAQDLGSPGTLVGTPAFMPPESFDGYADFRSDIYAFGATVSWMLSGEPTAAIQSPHVDRLPEKLRELLVRCLARSPDDRYQVFDRLIQDLYDPTLDDIASFDVDESRYDFCETHGFFSPRVKDAHAPRCLFCEQARELSDRLCASREIAKKRSWRPPAGARTDFLADEIATARLPSRDESSTRGAAEPAAENSANASAAESSAGSGDKEDRERKNGTSFRSILRRRAPVIIAALLAVSLGVILFITRSGCIGGETISTSGEDGTRNAGIDAALGSGAASLPPCAVSGCDRPVLVPSRSAASKRGIESGCEPTLCAEHGAFECMSCGHRSAIALSLDNLCRCCGAAVSRAAR